MILFDKDDTAGYDCYSNAVFKLQWTTDCQFSDKTRLFLNQDSFSDWFDGLDQIDELSGRIVVDNTPLPLGGASSELALAAMMTIRTDFEMQYNIKHLTIYCGLGCLLLLFIIFGQLYLCCKLRRDTNSKKAKLAEEYASTYSSGSKLLPKTH